MKLALMKQWIKAGSIISCMGIGVWAANPDTDQSAVDANNPNTSTVQHLKDEGNKGLNKVDNGVHEGVHTVRHKSAQAHKRSKKAAHRTGDSIQQTARDTRDATDRGLQKVDDAVHDR